MNINTAFSGIITRKGESMDLVATHTSVSMINISSTKDNKTKEGRL